MTVSDNTYLEAQYLLERAMGDRDVNSDVTMVPDGHEHMHLLIKQLPMPDLAPAGEIEYPTPMGAAGWQPQQLKVNFQGQVTLHETVRGHVRTFLEQIIKSPNRGRFNATIYRGTPDRHRGGFRIVDCFLTVEPTDRDWENRSQVTSISATMFGHYFATDKIPSNYVE
ncbi:MAG: hypothetical protein RLZZ373_3169 [Pseudomonadota bacterium]|jgi:hypothetical protein